MGKINLRMQPPKLWLCPYCGKWHKWEGDCLSDHYHEVQTCPDFNSIYACVSFKLNAYCDIEAYIEDACKFMADNNETICANDYIMDSMDEYTEEAGIGTFVETFHRDVHREMDEDICEGCDVFDKCMCHMSAMNYVMCREYDVKIGLSWEDDPHKKKETEQPQEINAGGMPGEANLIALQTSEGALKMMHEIPPRLWLCPYCGEWHEWIGRSLTEDEECNVVQICPKVGFRRGKVFFSKDWMDSFRITCSPICNAIKHDIYISEPEKKALSKLAKSDRNTGIGAFCVTEEFLSDCPISNDDCHGCNFQKECKFCEHGEKSSSHAQFATMYATAGLSWLDNPHLTKKEYQWLLSAAMHDAECKDEDAGGKQDDEEAFRFSAAEHAEECSNTETYGQDGNSNNATKRKEKTIMANENNLLNMPMEFGANEDENIASTFLGIAVFNGSTWRVYDKEKKVIVDIGDMELGNLPIYLVPSTRVEVGDLLKEKDGSYSFVTNVAQGKTETMNALTGELKFAVPVHNILGFSCYTKVAALGDMFGFGEDSFDVEDIVMMSAMSGGRGNNGNANMLMTALLMNDGGMENDNKALLMAMMMGGMSGGNASASNGNNMLPLLMLMKDKPGGKQDDNMLLAMAMMGMGNSNASGTDGANGNNMGNNMLPWMMLMGDKVGDKKDMMRMAMLMSASGGGTDTPLMAVLMDKMLFGGKDNVDIGLDAPDPTGGDPADSGGLAPFFPPVSP